MKTTNAKRNNSPSGEVRRLGDESSFTDVDRRATCASASAEALQAYLGRRSIQSTVRYTELASGRFKKTSGKRNKTPHARCGLLPCGVSVLYERGKNADNLMLLIAGLPRCDGGHIAIGAAPVSQIKAAPGGGWAGHQAELAVFRAWPVHTDVTFRSPCAAE